MGMSQPARLVLEDGSVFKGIAAGALGSTVGEVVFNTAMTGYQEILTDPSYRRQMVTLTYPHIGNTGVNRLDVESDKPHACGLIIRDLPITTGNWREEQTLPDYLREHGIVAIAGIDTRRLVRRLRSEGAQRGVILAGDAYLEQDAQALIESFPGLKGMDLAREVTTDKPYTWTQSVWSLQGNRYSDVQPDQDAKHVVALDFGVKSNMLRLLVERGCRVTVLPGTSTVDEVLAHNPDGVLLSNGPGDPEPCDYAITTIRGLLEKNMPLLGICLGHQLLALAAGARTVKMKNGHHGANHPVQDLRSGRVMITSQNHGFAVDKDSLPEHVEATHISLFDRTLQGIALRNAPAIGFQGHPEASPGPGDVTGLFDEFVHMIAQQ
jgi:carbamoyl-phosphate synthase small subunit